MIQFERLFNIMSKPWVILSFLVFIILSILYLDRPIAYYFHDLDLEHRLPILIKLTMLGLGGLYIIPLFLLALFFRYIKRNKEWETRTWFLWLCVFIPAIICLILKVSLGRARPELLFDEQLYGFYGFHTHAPFWSFPSGHTTNIMGLAFGLSVLFPRFCYAFILAGLAVVLSRILLTSHFLSDVLVASYLALLEIGLILWLFRRKKLLLQPAPN